MIGIWSRHVSALRDERTVIRCIVVNSCAQRSALGLLARSLLGNTLMTMPSEKTRYRQQRPAMPWFDLPDFSDGTAPHTILPNVFRSVLVLKAREPCLAWIDSIEPAIGARIRANPEWQRNCILIPGYDSLPSAEPWLRAWCHLIMADHLTPYTQTVAMWPADRSWDTFITWFDLDLIVGVRDLGSDPLEAKIWD